ncbi:MAG: O-antigen ligase family protein [Acidobacteriota bacterium]|nr:O-antigen ligase family protein [Acidobacteriota bacterium]
MRTIATQMAAVAGAWAIVSGGGNLRMLALGTTAAVLLLPFLFSLEAGLLAVVTFEPFRGILRRAQYLIVPYSEYEPIHLITPAISLVALLSLIFRHKLGMLWSTPLARPVFMLGAICFAQIFNPMQGSVFVGLTGAMFFLVPMVWFYFGQSVTFEFFGRLFKFVVVLALVSSLYGVYQIYVGYPEFELYWLTQTDNYSSVNVYDVNRALATFSNAEEWGRYVQIGCICAFGFGIIAKPGIGRVSWFGGGIALIGMLTLSGQRSSIFGLFLGLSVLFLTGSRTIGNALMRLGLLSLPLIIIFGFVNALSPDEIYDIDDNRRAEKILSHTARGTLDPASEGSLSARLETWNQVVTAILPANPVGYGLGSSTLGANRDGKRKTERAIDNHFLSLAIAAGVPAALLLMWILFRASVIGTRQWIAADPAGLRAGYYRIALALLSTFFLNNFFGTTFVIYSVAPLCWFVLGWLGRDEQDPRVRK